MSIAELFQFIKKNFFWVIVLFYLVGTLLNFFKKAKKEISEKTHEDYAPRPEEDYIDAREYYESELEENLESEFNEYTEEITREDIYDEDKFEAGFVKPEKKQEKSELILNKSESLREDKIPEPEVEKTSVFDFIEKKYNPAQKAFIYSEIFKKKENM